jgi:hypothetical protein
MHFFGDLSFSGRQRFGLRYEFLAAVTMKITVFWDATLYRCVPAFRKNVFKVDGDNRIIRTLVRVYQITRRHVQNNSNLQDVDGVVTSETQPVLPICWYPCTRLHGVITQKTGIESYMFVRNVACILKWVGFQPPELCYIDLGNYI